MKEKNYENDPGSIKYHVKKYLLKNVSRIKDKTVVDLPAGNGITSRIIKEFGGKPIAFDLFPEYFNIEGINCTKANIMEGIPTEDKIADFIVCQEGIEHFENQLKAFSEFNRILKPAGSLILSTPNYSNLRSKLSYFLSESERYNKMMPPNEIDSIWLKNNNGNNELYYGHIFLTGIQKLRILAILSGFKIKHIQFTRFKTSSFIIFLLTYPFILLSNCINYIKNINKNKNIEKSIRKKVYKEVFNLSINPKILIDKHLLIEYEKTCEVKEVAKELSYINAEFGTT
jgi:SAM-dependent methyltransferase